MKYSMFYAIGFIILAILVACYIRYSASSKTNKFNKNQLRTLENAFKHADRMIKSFFGEDLKVPIDLDVKTSEYLKSVYRVPGKLSQVVRYSGKRKGISKKQVSYYYSIAINDDEVLKAMKNNPNIDLLPFLTYIVTQQYVLIVRFTNFGVSFDKSSETQRFEEIELSHEMTYKILEEYKVQGRESVLKFFNKLRY